MTVSSSYDVRYSVAGMSQPTANACWATTFAMLLNYSKGTNLSPADVASAIGHDLETGSSTSDEQAVASHFGLASASSVCADVDGWAQMLQNYGPMYICVNGSTHAVLLTGLTSDGTVESTRFYINDPWDGAVDKGMRSFTEIFESIGDDTALYVYHA